MNQTPDDRPSDEQGAAESAYGPLPIGEATSSPAYTVGEGPGSPAPVAIGPHGDPGHGDDRPVADAPRRRGVAVGKVRGALAVLTVGALVGAGAAIAWDLVPESEDGEETEEVLAVDTGPDTVFASTVTADCVTWSDAEAPELEAVDCAEEHMFEVSAKVDLAPVAGMEFGPNALLPGVERLALIRDSVCATTVEDYLDGRLDPRGRYSVGLIRPSEAAWARGDRTILCGLQQTTVDGTVSLPTVGRVAEQDQSLVYQPGTCRGIVDGLPSDPVPCDQPHAVEVTAIIDLATEFPDAFPTPEQQDEFLEPTCRKASEDYVGGPEQLYDKQLTVFWDNIGESSWHVGSRLVNCTVGHGDTDGHLATIVGDVRGEITIDGHAPDPDAEPPAAPPAEPLPEAPPANGPGS